MSDVVENQPRGVGVIHEHMLRIEKKLMARVCQLEASNLTMAEELKVLRAEVDILKNKKYGCAGSILT